MEIDEERGSWYAAEAGPSGGPYEAARSSAYYRGGYFGSGANSSSDDDEDGGSVGDWAGTDAQGRGWAWSEDEEEGRSERAGGALPPAPGDDGVAFWGWGRWRDQPRSQQRQQLPQQQQQEPRRHHSDGEQPQPQWRQRQAAQRPQQQADAPRAETPPHRPRAPAPRRWRASSDAGTGPARPSPGPGPASSGGRGGLLWGAPQSRACGAGGGRWRGASDGGFGPPRRRLGGYDGDDEDDEEDEESDTCEEDEPPPMEVFDRQSEQSNDTTAAQVVRGKDPQGIPWGRLQFTREQYRQQRLATYRNYTNLIGEEDGPKVRAEICQGYRQPAKGGRAFAFVRNWRSVPSTIVHFQLRNLLWATGPHELFVVSSNAVSHWSAITGRTTEVLNLRGLPKGPRLPGIGRVQISTLGVDRELLAAGGFTGELVVARMRGGGGGGGGGGAIGYGDEGWCAEDEDDASGCGGCGDGYDDGDDSGGGADQDGAAEAEEQRRKRRGWRGSGFAGGFACGFGSLGRHCRLVHSGRVTQCENGITNGIEISSSARLGRAVLTANNDNNVRVFDAATLAPRARLPFPWAVNYATLRPESGGAPGGGAAAAVVGDDPVVCIVDLLAGRTALRLKGHRDYAFAAAWHPGGSYLATGNQDGTTMVWDVRAPGAALAAMPGQLGAVRALRWSADGRFLVASEPADYVHIYEMEAGVAQQVQEVDLFGEISGVTLSPCSSMLYIGVSDPMYSSVIQLQRRRGAAGAYAARSQGSAWHPLRPGPAAGHGDEEGSGGGDDDARHEAGRDADDDGGLGDGMAAAGPARQRDAHLRRHGMEAREGPIAWH